MLKIFAWATGVCVIMQPALAAVCAYTLAWPVPWMLAGGLNADNVAAAVSRSGAAFVDVSSGVESAPGKKDPAEIVRFLEAVAEL